MLFKLILKKHTYIKKIYYICKKKVMEEVKTAEIREKILCYLEEIHEMQKKVIDLYKEIGELNFEIYKKNSNISYIKMDIEYIEEKIDELEQQIKIKKNG